MKMKMSGGPASINIKIVLVIIALLIAVGTLIYTQNLYVILLSFSTSSVISSAMSKTLSGSL